MSKRDLFWLISPRDKFECDFLSLFIYLSLPRRFGSGLPSIIKPVRGKEVNVSVKLFCTFSQTSEVAFHPQVLAPQGTFRSETVSGIVAGSYS